MIAFCVFIYRFTLQHVCRLSNVSLYAESMLFKHSLSKNYVVVFHTFSNIVISILTLPVCQFFDVQFGSILAMSEST